ncbi:hypothetical protein [Desulfitobacterium metallireducens]|uniref:Uncharacterized protein n=1 Tax=Desulfitobacterium metallireducens DSM 15288 TaxID=871968 RepID=W0EDJ8_9FIRM|nr:hypothetical protein [Desulfitobacterium metallireducens]AHF07146.1 hypothetical protein DESME_08700 [Desulfitobacterium metallireducens DSM 15288]
MSEECTKLPGSLIRINIPGGAVINLLDLLEVASPDGICITVRSPRLGEEHTADDETDSTRGSLVDMVKKAKAVIDVLN